MAARTMAARRVLYALRSASAATGRLEPWKCDPAFGVERSLASRLQPFRLLYASPMGAEVGTSTTQWISNSGSGSGLCAPNTQITSKHGLEEIRTLLVHIQMTELKKKLASCERDCISYPEFLQLCQQAGVTSSPEDAAQVARSLHHASVVLIFRNNVYLHPERIAQLVENVLPSSSNGDVDKTCTEEFDGMLKEKALIDLQAHKGMRRILWSGMAFLTLKTALLFRLTYWDLSWDVIEPIAYFVTTSYLVAGYSYFLYTSKDPTYKDLMHTILLSRQRKLFKSKKFNLSRFEELKRQKDVLEWKG